MPQRRIPGRAIIARSVAKVGVQNMKIEQIRETAQKKLFVGKKVKVLEFGKDRHGANVLRKRRTGTVTGLYPSSSPPFLQEDTQRVFVTVSSLKVMGKW